MRRGRDLVHEKAVAGPDGFFEKLGHAFVEPDGHVGADGFIGELVEGFVLEGAAEGIALAFEIGGELVFAGDEYAAGVLVALPVKSV